VLVAAGSRLRNVILATAASPAANSPSAKATADHYAVIWVELVIVRVVVPIPSGIGLRKIVVQVYCILLLP